MKSLSLLAGRTVVYKKSFDEESKQIITDQTAPLLRFLVLKKSDLGLFFAHEQGCGNSKIFYLSKDK